MAAVFYVLDEISLNGLVQSMDDHVLQRTGCIDNEPEPSPGDPCKGVPRLTNQIRLDPTQRRAPGRRCNRVSAV